MTKMRESTVRQIPFLVTAVWLFPQTKLGNNGPVSGNVFVREVRQQPPTLTNQFQQAQLGTVIVLVNLEVGGQVTDPVGKQRDLGFCRAGVVSTPGAARRGENLLLFFGR